MQLDISPTELTTLALGLQMLAEVLENPQILDALSHPGKASVDDTKQKGLWPRASSVATLLNKLLARLQVEVEGKSA